MTARRVAVAAALLFLGYVVTGVRFAGDYGVPVDEYSQIDIGRVTLDRLRGSPELAGHYDRYYGPAFEVPLYLFSHALRDRFSVPEMTGRHIGVFLFFASGVAAFYFFLTRLFGHPAWGLAGALVLVAYPRFFAESMYNTKDMAFAAAVMWVLWAAGRESVGKWKSVLLTALLTGIAIGIRIQGLLVAGSVAAAVAVTAPGGRRRTAVAIYVTVTLIVSWLVYPVLWSDTFRHLGGLFARMADKTGAPTLYLGQRIISPGIPWHYHLVWVGVSAMLSVAALSVAGVIAGAVRFKTVRPGPRHAPLLIMAGIVIGTFAVSVFFRPRSYDGWRHIYYIYPAMTGLAFYAIRRLFASRRAFGIAAALLVAADVWFSVRFIVRNHPYEYVYFNPLAGGYTAAARRFDFDYWGISQKQLLEYLLTMPVTGPARIAFDQTLPYATQEMIPKLVGRGITFTDSVSDADYYVTVNKDFREQAPRDFGILYQVTVEGATVSAVYRRL